ncbi:acyl-[ACP]--phospholipid O-acyltransferase [Oryzibacter oryziterrae]|uniref:acyl-[ACP]--phospholipid O-acyltransferase n=1 Tax=Oryzibacter oryziterrae TaxID=2766474 RepID=UPI001F01C8CA|nr:acyl-[ACP]--phospholipid O-acyltransferase [Oryzibacter oryziterrae]
MSHSLLLKRRFGPLFLVQFFSAFNDNFLKNALVFTILFQMAGAGGESLVTIASAILMVPFILLSGLGGQMADRLDKAVVAQRLKLVEIAIAGVAVIGFLIHSIPVLMGALMGFGVISALFGPVKYGILPDHLKENELARGNALVEGATFIAILLGTFAGGFVTSSASGPIVFSAAMMTLALLSWISALFIPKTGAAAPDTAVDRNVFRSTLHLTGELWADTRLWRTGVMVSLFWMIGVVALALMPTFTKSILGGMENAISAYLTVFAVSIGVGSAIGSWLSAGRIVLLPVPLATVLIGLFALDLAWTLTGLAPAPAAATLGEFFAHPGAIHAAIDLSGLAIAGGIFIVPAFAAAQHWAPADRRARVVGAINALTAVFMVAGAGTVAATQALGATVHEILVGLGIFSLGAAVWIFRVMPSNPLRDFISILLRAVFRLEIIGAANVAKAGPSAILALNHTSFLDAVVAIALTDRDPVFAIDHTIAQAWWVKPFLRFTRALPLDPTRPLATRALIAAVKSGETLVIFPEGRLTVTGTLMKVYDGVGLIAEKSGAPIIPVRLSGLESTVFSRLNSMQVKRRWFPKVTVQILEPVTLSVPDHLRGKFRRQAAGNALYSIMSDMMYRTTVTDLTLFGALEAAARQHGPSRQALADPVAGPLSYKRLMMGARIIGGKLARRSKAGDAVALMVPNAVGGAVAFLGLQSAGRVPAMINFTAGPANILAACKAAEVKLFVTSRLFVEKGRLEPIIAALTDKVEVLYLEDLRAAVTGLDKLDALLNWHRPRVSGTAEDRAAILFTSGSEGTPKGVVLTHRNILTNVAQVSARIDFSRTDRVFNALPIFHSLGLSSGLMLPLVSGVPVYLYPTPLHYRIIPELVYQTNATVLFGTDTFLSGYARMAHPYDFRSVRLIVAGAEAVKEATRRAYMEKFGLRILEGYGVTETAPVLALNTPMYNRAGTVGRLMPGLETRLEPMPGLESGGRLMVRGPNVMAGYLRAENPGVLEVPVDGWHDTGDIVEIDADGFVAIRGRAKRFAKIGGEMVSLAAIEAIAGDCWPGANVACASLPDARKGERIVLVTDVKGATREDFQGFARMRGATELMMPSEILVVDALPLLGSGKTDFPAVTRLVKERLG